ncbi:hypothetical protein, partial [Frankia sp. CiP1_Cm_nod1]|uniref:hypothetical protein n=1 Tax=Frankia sp. CiP1_Cm_nod1 TaxID=2897160 RepID=UPI0020246108
MIFLECVGTPGSRPGPTLADTRRRRRAAPASGPAGPAVVPGHRAGRPSRRHPAAGVARAG